MIFTRMCFCFLAGAVAACLAQPGAIAPQPGSNPPAQQVQLAVPFGTVEGQLVISGRNLMFIDPQHPTASFTIPRDDIRNLTTQGTEMTVDLARPVQDSAGQASRLVFRLMNSEGARQFVQWFDGGASAAAQPAGTADRVVTPNSSAPPVTLSFQAKHDHRIGSDTGRLMLTPTQLIYESVSNVNSSRQWNLADIKEVKRDSPYKIKIVPFAGNEYNFDLLGQGMNSDQYQMLVDAVTRARISRKP